MCMNARIIADGIAGVTEHEATNCRELTFRRCDTKHASALAWHSGCHVWEERYDQRG